MENPWTKNDLLRPIEWPLRIVAVILAGISAIEIWSEAHVPHPQWLLIIASFLFGGWFGYLGIMGRRPGK